MTRQSARRCWNARGETPRATSGTRFARPDVGGMPRGAAEPDDVVADLVVDGDRCADEIANAADVARRQARAGLRPFHALAQHVHFVVMARIADAQQHAEAIQLRLGQRIDAFLLHRVLRRQHPERIGQRIRGVGDGDLPLLHRLEQRALRLGRGAVDLVGQQDVGEDRSLLGAELAGLRVVDARADDVGRQQVGRELDAMELGRDGARDASWPSASWPRPARLRAARARTRPRRRSRRR